MTDDAAPETGAPETLVTLIEAKGHLRVDVATDDALIAAYLAAAHRTALDYCRRTDWPEGAGARAAFKVAVMLILGDLYVLRDLAPQTDQMGPGLAARMLIDPYRNLSV